MLQVLAGVDILFNKPYGLFTANQGRIITTGRKSISGFDEFPFSE
jgi:hypothetical protein